MSGLQPLGLDPAMLDEARTYLRIEDMTEDPSLASTLLAAIAHAEQFTGLVLMERSGTQIISAHCDWQPLSYMPILSIPSATGLPADGSGFALTSDAWAKEIDYRGEAFIRIMRPGIAGRAEIAFTAGLAANWSSLPEALRLGILRLAAHLYHNRDSSDDAGPPAAVAALLRPWRQIRVGQRTRP